MRPLLRFLFVASQRSCLKSGDEICIERRGTKTIKPAAAGPASRAAGAERAAVTKACRSVITSHTHKHTLSLSPWIERARSPSQRCTLTHTSLSLTLLLTLHPGFSSPSPFLDLCPHQEVLILFGRSVTLHPSTVLRCCVTSWSPTTQSCDHTLTPAVSRKSRARRAKT